MKCDACADGRSRRRSSEDPRTHLDPAGVHVLCDPYNACRGALCRKGGTTWCVLGSVEDGVCFACMSTGSPDAPAKTGHCKSSDFSFSFPSSLVVSTAARSPVVVAPSRFLATWRIGAAIIMTLNGTYQFTDYREWLFATTYDGLKFCGPLFRTAECGIGRGRGGMWMWDGGTLGGDMGPLRNLGRWGTVGENVGANIFGVSSELRANRWTPCCIIITNTFVASKIAQELVMYVEHPFSGQSWTQVFAKSVRGTFNTTPVAAIAPPNALDPVAVFSSKVQSTILADLIPGVVSSKCVQIAPPL
jgi:hypothetical protein